MEKNKATFLSNSCDVDGINNKHKIPMQGKIRVKIKFMLINLFIK